MCFIEEMTVDTVGLMNTLTNLAMAWKARFRNLPPSHGVTGVHQNGILILLRIAQKMGNSKSYSAIP
jgi:hypothetical protein